MSRIAQECTASEAGSRRFAPWARSARARRAAERRRQSCLGHHSPCRTPRLPAAAATTWRGMRARFRGLCWILSMSSALSWTGWSATAWTTPFAAGSRSPSTPACAQPSTSTFSFRSRRSKAPTGSSGTGLSDRDRRPAEPGSSHRYPGVRSGVGDTRTHWLGARDRFGGIQSWSRYDEATSVEWSGSG